MTLSKKFVSKKFVTLNPYSIRLMFFKFKLQSYIMHRYNRT